MKNPARITRRLFLASGASLLPLRAQGRRTVLVVSNFHPASCGWLTNFSKERVYCANSYFDHLDRVGEDSDYAFVLSECNNLIAMMNFKPERKAELLAGIRKRQVELVNAFFLESTVNLSGGEALVRLGVEGLRWQQQMFGVKPRIGWTIDVCGTHDQMAQICAGLGLDAMVYTRKNPTGSALHWAESPDGTKILAIAPGHYSELAPFFRAKEPLDGKGLAEIQSAIERKAKITPDGAPILILGGGGDYSLPPPYKAYPREFLKQWREARPETSLRFVTMSHYLDAILPGVRSGEIRIPTMRGGTEYDFLSFWIESPRVKSWYRKDEQHLHAAEALSTIASLTGGYRYPVQPLYHAWVQMFLNMDRNTLWGAAGGMVFEHDRSWDARDRFEWVERTTRDIQQTAGRAWLRPGKQTALFNPLTWKRSDPLALNFVPAGVPSQAMPDGTTLCRLEVPPFAAMAVKSATGPAPAAKPMALPETIDTRHYQVRIDPKTGAIASLKLKASGRELLSAPANVIQMERPLQFRGDPGDHMDLRAGRKIVATSSDSPVEISAAEGPLATIVSVVGGLPGAGPCRRTLVFHHDHPRIDFQTELNDVPDRTVVTTEFPLGDAIAEVRRGIPYGFSHGAWEKEDPNLHGWTKGITPAVRYSHYSLAGGGGLAILDRGLTGRELVGRSPILFLLNASEKYSGYPNSWLSGKGKHLLDYAVVAHDGAWRSARIPHLAWEYNSPVLALPGVGQGTARPLLEASENIMVEGFRRDGPDIELRFAECLGHSGTAEIRLHLPHKQAFLTDLTGGHAQPLAGGPQYSVPVRPQQIVTIRFRTAATVGSAKAIERWDELVPENKRAALHEYSGEKGHPPRGV